MNTEELSESLRTEINTYLKNAVADLQQEIVGLQERLNHEVERYRTEMQRSFDELLAKGAATTIDDQFARLVAEHIEIAFEDGIKEGKDAGVAEGRETGIAEGKAAAEAEFAANPPQAAPQSESQTVAAAAQAAPANYSAMRDAIGEISQQTSQAEILKSLVKHSSAFAPRGAFFIVKSDHLVGWRTFGSELEQSVDAVREVFMPLSSNTLLGTSIKQNAVQTVADNEASEDAQYLQKLSFNGAAQKVAIPLVVRGRGVAVLYADSGENNTPIDVDALEALVRVSGLTVELLAAAKSPAPAAAATAPAVKPQPQANQYAPAAQMPQPPEANIYQPATVASEVFATAQTSEPTFAAQPANGTVETKAIEPSFAPAAEVAARSSAFETVAPQTAQSAPRVETSFSFDTAQPSNNGFSSPVESKPAPQQAAPRRFGERNLELPIDVPEDERRLHNDARRFARLLVSEIKLYNEQKVREGRQASDLYSRLREAVDRSREMYDKRVSPPVAAKFDYFNYELVSTLAEGDEKKLGGDYPGAAV